MLASDTCLTAIKNWEGCRLTVYADLNGFATVGYGHKLGHGESYPNGITQDEADEIFQGDVGAVEGQVSGIAAKLNLPVLLQGQFDALVSFTFNLGPSNLQVMLGHGFDQVPQQLVRWVHAGTAVQPGLVARRNQEVRWWTGSESNPS